MECNGSTTECIRELQNGSISFSDHKPVLAFITNCT